MMGDGLLCKQMKHAILALADIIAICNALVHSSTQLWTRLTTTH